MRPLERISQLCGLTWSDKLAYLTHEFHKLPQLEAPVTHHFEDGLYIREMTIPKDALFIGRPHIHGHECQLAQGRILHITEHARMPLEAPFAIHTTPGYQMVLYALTDVVGRTVHPNPTNSRDIAALELDIFESVELLRERGQEIARTYLESPCQASAQLLVA